jgi:hypothetical protein
LFLVVCFFSHPFFSSFLETSKNWNQDEASLLYTSEALLGALVSINDVQFRRAMKVRETTHTHVCLFCLQHYLQDALLLRQHVDLSSATIHNAREHILSMKVLPRQLSRRALTMLQTLFDASIITRSSGRTALRPRPLPTHKDRNTHKLSNEAFDKTVALDGPALRALIKLTYNVTGYAESRGETRLADAVSALQGQLSALLHGLLNRNNDHLLGQSDEQQAEALERALERNVFASRVELSPPPQHARLVQELRKLAGGFYGGVAARAEVI